MADVPPALARPDPAPSAAPSGAEVPVTNPTTGEIRMVPRSGVQAFVQQTGWHVSTADQREVAAENLESGSVGQQALAAGEQAVRTGTFGIAPGLEGWEQREKVLRRESPVVSGVAQGVGAIAPALATGGLAGGLAGGLGLGARAAGAAAVVGEGLAGGLADEVEQARYETRDVSLGNVMLYGLGGELVGRALPHALSMGAGSVKRALTGAEAAAGHGLTDALVGAEERALGSQAGLAHELPKGSPERLEALRATAPQQYDRIATETAEDLDAIADLTGKMADTGKGSKTASRLKESVAEASPAQVEFFTAMKGSLTKVKDGLRAPVEEGGSLIEQSGMKSLGKKFDSAIDQGLRKLDKTTDTAEQFLIARDVKRDLQKVSQELAELPANKRGPMWEQARKAVDDTWQGVHDGLKDRSLFGAASDIEADVSGPYGEKILRGKEGASGLAKGGQYDPSKLRSFLKGDALDRKLTQGQLEQMLEGAEEMAAAHERHGTWSADQIGKLRESVSRVRDRLGFADELQAVAKTPVAKTAADSGVQAAKKTLGQEAVEQVKNYAVNRAGSAVGAGIGSLVGGPVGAALGWGAGEVAQKIGKRLLSIDAAGRAATKQAARNLAGVGAGFAERMSGKDVARGMIDRIRARTAEEGSVTIRGAATPKIDKRYTKLAGALEKYEGKQGSKGARLAELEGARDVANERLRAIEDRLNEAGDAERGALEKELEDAYAQEEKASSRLFNANPDASDSALERHLGDIEQDHEDALEALLSKHGADDAEGLPAGARKKFDRLQADLDEVRSIRSEHTEQVAVEGGNPVGLEDYAKSAKAVLAKLSKEDTEAGFVRSGPGIRDILTSPMGVTAAVGVGALALPTALARFQGDFSSAEASFDAKKKVLDQHSIQPEILYETLGNALGDLPEVRPDLFMQIAQRTSQKLSFVKENLPPGLQASLLYPNGTPPSQSDLRDFATLWNTVMEPETVLQDLNSGTATQQQMQTLKKSDPELYDQLRSDIIEQVGANFQSVPTSTKASLDLLLEADGLAGPLYSSTAARYIGDAKKLASEQAQPAQPPPGGKAPPAATPSGISAIQTSVTNRQAA